MSLFICFHKGFTVNYNSCSYKFDLYAYYNCNTLGNGLWLFMHFLAFSSMITLTYMISLSFLYFRWDYSIYMVYFVHLSHCISTLDFEDPQVTARPRYVGFSNGHWGSTHNTVVLPASLTYVWGPYDGGWRADVVVVSLLCWWLVILLRHVLL